MNESQGTRLGGRGGGGGGGGGGGMNESLGARLGKGARPRAWERG